MLCSVLSFGVQVTPLRTLLNLRPLLLELLWIHSLFAILPFFPALAVASGISTDCLKNINIFALTGFVDSFGTEQFAAKLELFLLNVKRFPG